MEGAMAPLERERESEWREKEVRLHALWVALRTKRVIRAAADSEVVISDTNECTICGYIKVLTNDALFIISEHKSWNNPIGPTLLSSAWGMGRGLTQHRLDKTQGPPAASSPLRPPQPSFYFSQLSLWRNGAQTPPMHEVESCYLPHFNFSLSG